ncbi:hypothetical protein ACFWHL_02450 [Streptomyces massasporeus]
MSWDDILLLILAFFGAVSLLLAQVSDVLSRLPNIIRAWREIRRELSGGGGDSDESGFTDGAQRRDH